MKGYYKFLLASILISSLLKLVNINIPDDASRLIFSVSGIFFPLAINFAMSFPSESTPNSRVVAELSKENHKISKYFIYVFLISLFCESRIIQNLPFWNLQTTIYINAITNCIVMSNLAYGVINYKVLINNHQRLLEETRKIKTASSSSC